MKDFYEKFIEMGRKWILERMNLYEIILSLDDVSLLQNKQPDFEDSEYWYFNHEHGTFKGYKIRKRYMYQAYNK